MSARILLIDDDEIDAEFVRRMIQREELDIELEHADDGIAGLEFLRAEGEFSDKRSADLVLLDLQMPRMDGREFLAELRKDESLRRTLVVVLLASHDFSRSLEQEGLEVDDYLVKPVQADELVEAMKRLNVI